MATFLEGRRCVVCGAHISDNNPDGIGSTCREVWQKAKNSAFYHFCGLEFWIEKSHFWAKLFVETFRKTKFRSGFNKDFYATINNMVASGTIKISSKMLSIIKNKLVDGGYPKLSEIESKIVISGERELLRGMKEQFLGSLTEEQNEYIQNLAKKYYGESSINN